MSLVAILVPIVVVGLLLWAVNAIIPMNEQIKKILNVVAIVIICLWLLQSFGFLGNIGTVGVR